MKDKQKKHISKGRIEDRKICSKLLWDLVFGKNNDAVIADRVSLEKRETIHEFVNDAVCIVRLKKGIEEHYLLDKKHIYLEYSYSQRLYHTAYSSSTDKYHHV